LKPSIRLNNSADIRGLRRRYDPFLVPTRFTGWNLVLLFWIGIAPARHRVAVLLCATALARLHLAQAVDNLTQVRSIHGNYSPSGQRANVKIAAVLKLGTQQADDVVRGNHAGQAAFFIDDGEGEQVVFIENLRDFLFVDSRLGGD
jgi:hypothetical protein